MKQIKIKTSRGNFLVIDGDIYLENKNGILTAYTDHAKKVKLFCYEKYIKLSETTEEQASEIVDSNDEYGVVMYQNYQTTSMQYFDEQITAIESLHSLLRSKGCHLYENPINKPENYDLWAKYGDFTQYGKQLTKDCLAWKEALLKTFYNPYIFKIND